ncbi:unnamed protein product [Trichobilharzia regenti]|nr:unnamed protein product [Trichobilharzia regenti]
MKTRETCIKPKQDKISVDKLSPSLVGSQFWLQHETQVNEFNYAIDPEQLNFLKITSDAAVQRIYFSCRGLLNSASNSTVSLAESISLLGDDDSVLERNHPLRRFKIEKDQCGKVILHVKCKFCSQLIPSVIILYQFIVYRIY